MYLDFDNSRSDIGLSAKIEFIKIDEVPNCRVRSKLTGL